MPSCHQTAIVEEGHAAEFGVLGGFHFGYHVQFFEVPQKDCIVERTGDHFGRVRDLIFMRLDHFAWFEHDNFEDRLGVSF